MGRGDHEATAHARARPPGEPDALLSADRGHLAAHRTRRSRAAWPPTARAASRSATTCTWAWACWRPPAPATSRAGCASPPSRPAIGEISYVEAGVGPPLLALHGLGGTKASLPAHARRAGGVPPRDRPRPAGLRRVGQAHRGAVRRRRGSRARWSPRWTASRSSGRTWWATAWAAGWRSRRGCAMPTGSTGWCCCAPRSPGCATAVGRRCCGCCAPSWACSRWPRGRWSSASSAACCRAPTDGWAAAGVDEFLRSYLTPRGRAAFYAAARNIYLDEPDGESGFWARLSRARARLPVHLGPPRQPGAGGLPPPRGGLASAGTAPGPRLRPRAPGRGAAPHPPRDAEVPGRAPR